MAQELEYILVARVLRIARHNFRRFERPATREHSQPSHQAPLSLGKQLVAPVNGGLESLLAPRGSPRAAGQQAKTLIETRRDPVDAERRETCGCQLDGQWD